MSVRTIFRRNQKEINRTRTLICTQFAFILFVNKRESLYIPPTMNEKQNPSRTIKHPTPEPSIYRTDFRLLLQSELTRRCQANPSYSLRSFARFLELESSRLSKILRGDRPASVKLIPRLGQKLGLSQKEINAFCEAAQKRRSPKDFRSKTSYMQLSLDVFESIEDWKHYAILELIKIRGFRPTMKWIAKALGITVSEARAYTERLARVGLLEIRPDGSWHDRSDGFSSHILGENETTYAHRRSQRQILELAAASLETIPIEKRDQSSVMMATSQKKILEAKRRIREFRRDLCDFLEDGSEKDSVFQLSISLFPMVEIEVKSE